MSNFPNTLDEMIQTYNKAVANARADYCLERERILRVWRKGIASGGQHTNGPPPRPEEPDYLRVGMKAVLGLLRGDKNAE